MQDVLDTLIEKADDGAVSAQVMLVSGYQFNGAIKHCDHGDNVYEALSAVPVPNPATGRADIKMHRIYFKGDDIRVVAVESPEAAPRIQTPGNGIHIPGRR